LEGTELGFTALPWAPLGWRQLQTYQDVFLLVVDLNCA
jgi:hypothetical protein